MICWVDGNECIYQSGDEYGLLNVAANVCETCSRIYINVPHIGRFNTRQMSHNVEHMLEEAGIELAGEREEPIEIEDQHSLINDSEIALEALELLEEKLEEAQCDAEEVQRLVSQNEEIINRREYIRIQRSFLDSIKDKDGIDSLKRNIIGSIQDCESRVEAIEQEIRKNVEAEFKKKIDQKENSILLLKEIFERLEKL